MNAPGSAPAAPEPRKAYPSASRPPLQWRLAYLQMTQEDAKRLRALLPRFEEYFDEFVEQFYEHLLSFEESRRFLQDPELVQRLKQTQKEHFRSLLQADWGPEYEQRRVQVGYAHAQAGIEPDLYLGAYQFYIQFCFSHFMRNLCPELSPTLEQLISLIKAIFLDIELTLEAYFEQTTRQLHQALEMYWNANRELRQFAQLTSHDLKTPLATVANLCDEVLDEFGEQIPPEAQGLISKAQTHIFRMSRMIDELLAHSLSLGESVEEAEEEIDTAQVVQEVLARLEGEIQARGVKLDLPQRWPVVLGDPVALKEALYNVFSNATKYCDSQNGRVQVRVFRRDGDWVLAIRDNGPGIRPEDMPRLFTPFARLRNHQAVPGSGLGLYFARRLVEQQGGRIWAESTPGQGTTFYIQLRSADVPSSPVRSSA